MLSSQGSQAYAKALAKAGVLNEERSAANPLQSCVFAGEPP